MTRLRGTDDMAQPGSCLSKRLSDRRDCARHLHVRIPFEGWRTGRRSETKTWSPNPVDPAS